MRKLEKLEIKEDKTTKKYLSEVKNLRDKHQWILNMLCLVNPGFYCLAGTHHGTDHTEKGEQELTMVESSRRKGQEAEIDQGFT